MQSYPGPSRHKCYRKSTLNYYSILYLDRSIAIDVLPAVDREALG
ncbi:MAG TPA: hypothetical protein VGQ81_16600 [Acidobacteriota bacterium]|nr:hypothetical protein [Acidobacteriota bacterium]